MPKVSGTLFATPLLVLVAVLLLSLATLSITPAGGNQLTIDLSDPAILAAFSFLLGSSPWPLWDFRGHAQAHYRRGEHGTPFREGGDAHLQKMLDPERTHVVVSTVPGKHGDENPVPYAPRMQALGALASNARPYPNAQEEELRQVSQPQRTDLEPQAAGATVRYVDVRISPHPA